MRRLPSATALAAVLALSMLVSLVAVLAESGTAHALETCVDLHDESTSMQVRVTTRATSGSISLCLPIVG